MTDNWQPAPQLLKNRTILITGAGDGIGRAVAKHCAALGATVILLGKTIPKLEAVYDEIEDAGGPQPAIYPINLEGATPKDYEDLAQTLDEEFGQLDGLVHNAAQLGTLAPIAHFDHELWHKIMQVNLNAPFFLTRACLGLLMKSPDSSVIFVSDSVGRKGRAYWGAYGASKSGLEGLMQILADELETNTSVRVNSLNPGPVRTRLRRNAYPAEDTRKLPTPEDVVNPFVFLLGPDATGITGHQFDAQSFDYSIRST